MSVILIVSQIFFLRINTFLLSFMNKSFTRPPRQFGIILKNTLNEQECQEKLTLKSRSRKRSQNSRYQLMHERPEMNYFDEVLKYVLTTISYPHILKGPEKVKRDIESLLHEITSINGQNCIWHQNFLNQGLSPDSLFMNKDITLDKRTTLIDWIIAVHKKYTLREETLFLTVKIIDEYAQKNNLPLKKYQLLGISALFMAAKYVEIQLPKFKDYHRLIQNQFMAGDMIEMESELLCKCHFVVSKKISPLWYLQAFAIPQIIFPSAPKYSKSSKQNLTDNRATASKQSIDPEQKFEKFMQFSRYILNLIQLDYKISFKYKQDIVAVSTLVFTTLNKQFLDSDGKGLLKFFTQTKSRLIEENEKPDEICKMVKKCMKKIENLYHKRGEKRFENINLKFEKAPKKL